MIGLIILLSLSNYGRMMFNRNKSVDGNGMIIYWESISTQRHVLSHSRPATDNRALDCHNFCAEKM